MTKWKRSSAADPTDLPPSEESEEVQSFPSTTSNSPDVVSTDISTTTQLASIRQVFSYGDFHVKVVCLSLGLFFAAIAGSIAPVMAFYFAKAFEELVADPNSPGFMKQVKELTWTFLVLGVVAFVSLCGYATLLETSAGNMTKDFQQQWFRALLRQDMAYFDVKDVSGVATLISTNGAKFKRGVGIKLGMLVNFTCTFLGGFIYAFYASWRTSLVVLCTVPFMAASGWFLVKMTTTTTQRANASYAQAASVAYTTASSIRTILSLNAVNTMIENFMAATAQAYNDATSQVAWLGVANGCMMGSFLLASIAVPLYGGSLLWKQIEESRCDPSGTVTDNASCDPSGMDVFGAMFGIFLAAAVLPQLTTIQESITNARVACYLAQETMNRKLDDDEIGPTEGDAQETTKTTAADSNRLRDKIRRGHSKLPEYKIDCMSPRGLRPKKLKGEIEFSKVTFAYPTRQETNVLDQFSLKIEAGKSIAICGCSGSGKSTIVQLLERNYDVQAGSIKIDSHDIRDLNVKWLRSHIGLVQQEPKLFGTSIAENIRYGNPEATIEEIEDACKAANAHAFIESFPDGYNTQVGDMGGKLSGGQKQRIAIARVLVRHPKILVLDEATSALDSDSERQVQKSIDKLMKSKKNKRTTIIIAHRLSTIRNADVIVVVKSGRVVESGTHDDMMQKGGEYFNLVQHQTHGKVLRDKQEPEEIASRHSSTSEALNLNCDGHPILQFQNVKFSYPTRPENQIFRNLNLSIKQGENLALVGPSGEGKSSIIALLERFYNPDEGSILVNGIKLTSLNVSWWRSQVALVSQEPVLLDMSIGENIAFALVTDNVTQQQIEEAAKKANCHDFIMEFPDGYNTQINSGLVSGGQKQRICIARALLRKPKILLLDEATSALDSESESVVQESINMITANANLTTIVISHRLSSIKKADRIAVIMDGKVKEIGMYEELMAKPMGHFRHLQQIQFGDDRGTMKARKKIEKKKTKKQSTDLDEKEEEIPINKEKEKANAKRARLMARQDLVYFVVGGIGALLAGAVFPAWGFIFAYTIELLYWPIAAGQPDIYYSNSVDDMKTLAANIALGSLGTILASLSGNILLYYGFGIAVERMNQRVRNNAFKSLCRQECGYFDFNPVGKITSELQDDAAMVHSFTGEPIRSLIVSLSSVLVGIVIGFYYMWPFALLFLGILPFLGFGAEMEMQMYVSGEDEGDDTVEDENSPGGIMVESLLDIRTIASLTMEDAKLIEYSDALRHQDAHPLRNNCIKGCGSGLGQFFQYWGLGLMFWFGAWVLSEYPNMFKFRDFLISMMALFFSLYGLTVAFENATDRTKAKIAAERIFSLIDRVSAIDPLCKDGECPDEMFLSTADVTAIGHHHKKKTPYHHHHKKGSSSPKLGKEVADAEVTEDQHKNKISMKLMIEDDEAMHKKHSSKKSVEEDKGDVKAKKPSIGRKKKQHHKHHHHKEKILDGKRNGETIKE